MYRYGAKVFTPTRFIKKEQLTEPFLSVFSPGARGDQSARSYIYVYIYVYMYMNIYVYIIYIYIYIYIYSS